MINVELANQAARLLQTLKQRGQKIVLAESCTAGLVAASLGRHAGASQVLCGSIVSYRNSMKENWLDVRRQTIDGHSAVSAEVTREMAGNLLRDTAEADIAAAVTGHLEPGQTATGHPLAWICIAYRSAELTRTLEPRQHPLHGDSRSSRQQQAGLRVVQSVLKFLHN